MGRGLGRNGVSTCFNMIEPQPCRCCWIFSTKDSRKKTQKTGFPSGKLALSVRSEQTIPMEVMYQSYITLTTIGHRKGKIRCINNFTHSCSRLTSYKIAHYNYIIIIIKIPIYSPHTYSDNPLVI